MPLVSICLPTLNALRFIEPRMESIMAQTLTDWELIVCDSVSDDGTWEYFQKFRSDPRIKLYQVPREGLFAGWNESLRRVTGEYVYIATADDTCSPKLLEKMTGALEGSKRLNTVEEESDDQQLGCRTNSKGSPQLRRVPTQHNAGMKRSCTDLPIDIAVCDFDFVDEDGNVIPPTQGIPGSFYGDWLGKRHRRSGQLEFLIHTCIGTSWTTITAVVFRASILSKVGLFRTDTSDRGEAFADRFWAMKTALVSDTVYLPEKLATWRSHSSQASKFVNKGWRKRNLCLTDEVLTECEGRIPPAWRSDPCWKERLLFGMRQYYLSKFQLNRHDLQRHPAQFIRGLFCAVSQEPSYLARRLCSGLSWHTADMQDSRDYVRALVRDWQVPWPPVPVGD